MMKSQWFDFARFRLEITPNVNSTFWSVFLCDFDF